MRGIFKEDSKKRVRISGAARKMFRFERALARANFRLDEEDTEAIISLVLSWSVISAGSHIVPVERG